MNKNNVSIFGVAFFICAPISPLLYFMGINVSIFVMALGVPFLFFMVKNRSYYIDGKVLAFVGGIFLLMVAPSLYWGNYRYISLPFYYIFGIFFASLINYDEHLVCVEILTKLCCLFLFGAILGQIYVFVGGSYLYEFTMADSRSTFLFPFTLSNVVLNNTIRAASLFDEPGTFSFFVCFLVAYRELLGKNRFVTDLLMILGLVTFSFAHVIFLILYILNKKNIKQISVVLFILCAMAFFFGFGEDSFFYEVFFNRFEVVDGVIVGDNRSEPLILAFNSIDISTLFFGKDPSCVFDREVCHAKYGYMGENFLSPLVFYGIFGSAFYYFSILALLSCGLLMRKNFLLFIGVVAILLQRPYSMSAGYSLMVALLFFSSRHGINLNYRFL